MRNSYITGWFVRLPFTFYFCLDASVYNYDCDCNNIVRVSSTSKPLNILLWCLYSVPMTLCLHDVLKLQYALCIIISKLWSQLKWERFRTKAIWWIFCWKRLPFIFMVMVKLYSVDNHEYISQEAYRVTRPAAIKCHVSLYPLNGLDLAIANEVMNGTNIFLLRFYCDSYQWLICLNKLWYQSLALTSIPVLSHISTSYYHSKNKSPRKYRKS